MADVAAEQPPTDPEAGVLPGAQIKLVIAALFTVVVVQQSVLPILAPLARAVGLAEWQIGVMMSVAALTLVLTGTRVGRRASSHGSKPVLLLSLSVGAAAMAAFALVAGLGLGDVLGAAALFPLFILTRGILFGGAMSAVMAATQTYIASVTTTEPARVRGMAAVGAAQGMAMVTGAAVGGVLSLFGILTPIAVAPITIAAVTLLLAKRLKPDRPEALVTEPRRVSPFDRRILPFLLAGFGMFTALGFLQLVIGFLITDRYSFSEELTGTVAGASILAAGIGMILAQAVVVPRSGWSPKQLLLVGTGIAAVGIAGLIPDMPLAVLVIAVGLAGLGIGIAMPGFTAGPTLVVDPDERGGVAGLITATMGLTFVVAPTLATVLYSVRPELPVIVGAVWMLATCLFVLLHPGFRTKPTPSV